MSAIEKSAELFNEEGKLLSSRIFRLSLLWIALLVVLVVTISHAFEELDSESFQSKLSELRASAFLTSMPPRPITEYDYLIDDPYKDVVIPSYSKPIGEMTPDELKVWNDNYSKFHQANLEVNELLRSAFLLKLPVLGAGVEIDLRTWVYALPFLFILVEAFLFILRRKLKLLNLLTASQMKEREQDKETSRIDRVTLSGEATESLFARHPAQLERGIYYVLNIAALGFFVDTGANLWVKWDHWRQGQFVLMIFTSAFWAVSYCHYVSNQMERHLTDTIQWSPRKSLTTRIWERGRAKIQAVVSKLRPSISLTTGSLLVLSTLYLATASSCESEIPEKGYKLFLGREGSYWFPATMLQYWDDVLKVIGRTMYVAGVVIGALTLVVLLGSVSRRKYLPIARVYKVLFKFSGCISLFVLADYSFSIFWYRDELFIPRTAFWLVPTVSWFYLAIFSNAKKPAAWERLRGVILIAFLPLAIDAGAFFVYAIMARNLIGVPLFFVGVQLLTLGYMKLVLTEQLDSRRRLVGSASP